MPTALVTAFPHDQSGNPLTRRWPRRAARAPTATCASGSRSPPSPACPRPPAPRRPHRGRPPRGPPDRGAVSRGRDAHRHRRPPRRRDRRLQGPAGILTARYWLTWLRTGTICTILISVCRRRLTCNPGGDEARARQTPPRQEALPRLAAKAKSRAAPPAASAPVVADPTLDTPPGRAPASPSR